MDFMDVDQILDVPDTPDRIPTRNINATNCIKRGNYSSATNHSRAKDLSDEVVRNRSTERGPQRLLFQPSKSLSISGKSDHHVSSSVSTLRNSSSPKNALPLKRMEKGKGICTSNSDRAEEFQKPFLPANALSSSRGPSNSTSALANVGKVNENVDEKCKVGFSSDRGKGTGLVVDSQLKVGRIGQKRLVRNGCISPLNTAKVKESIEAPNNGPSNSTSALANVGKVNDNVDEKCKAGFSSDQGKGTGLVDDSQLKVGRIGQKRLVRNGCISSLNIAKVKESIEAPNTGPVRVGPGDVGAVASESQPGRIDIKDLVTEPCDSHKVRGKTVINHHLSSKGSDGISSRTSKTSNEKNTDGTGNSSGDGYKSVGEELGRWRSTRNRTKNTNPPSSSVPPFVETVQPANARFKRQKQGPTSTTHEECSTSNFDDSELVCLGSSGARNRNGPGSLDAVIEIDEFSPQVRNNSSHNDDSEIRARQLEADEMLARELQEELYNEVPVVGAPVGEVDADIALALQQQESSPRAVPTRTRAVRPRGSSLISNLGIQPQSLSTRNPTIRRSTPVRAPTSTRMARLRARFPGQPRTLSSSSSSSSTSTSTSRGGTSLFPPNMDLDMRMHILETLESFSDMGMPGGALHVQRDFNENDYEMLLALDENNHQHGGASLVQINGLPQSTVQSDNHQEACAVCLDTPTIGDTIRHLPCLHKFHKDCIDPWLRRKTLCPVCKSSIT